MALRIPSSGASPELTHRGGPDFLLCYTGALLGIAVPGPAFSGNHLQYYSTKLFVWEDRAQENETLALTNTRLITTLTSPDLL